MRIGIVAVIFAKELRDMLRDRRTVLAMVAIPLVLYPALLVAGSQVAIIQHDQMVQDLSNVAIVPPDNPLLARWLEGIPNVRVEDEEDVVAGLESGALDAWVSAPSDFEERLASGETAEVTIHYDATESLSREAARRIERALAERGELLLKRRLMDIGVTESYVKPLQVSEQNEAPVHKATGTVLGMALPIIMVIMVGIGAFYPAIDLTAGEKERGTFETLLASPVHTVEIVGGKYLAVFCLATLSGLLNLASLLLTFAAQLWQLGDRLGPLELNVSVSAVMLIVGALVPFALFVSAGMMAVAVCTRSFREGQSVVTPLLLLMLFPAAYVAVPGASLTPATTLIPVTNVALLFKEAMTGESEPVQAVAVVLVTFSYAALALLGAARLFQREEVVLSEQGGLPLTLRRSAFTPRSRPAFTLSLGLFALCGLLVFYLGSYWQARNPVLGVLLTQWLLILLPTAVVLWYFRISLRRTLLLHRPSARGMAGVVVLALGWLVLSIEGGYWQQRLLPMPEELGAAFEKVFAVAETDHGFWFLWAAVALSPAVCEEALFRGAVLSGLRQRLSAPSALVVMAVLFAIAHLSVYRAPMTFVSGLVLGYVVWRTGSLFLSMGVHLFVNSMGVLAEAGRLPGTLQRYVESEAFAEKGLPWWVTVSGAVVFGLGVVILGRGDKVSANE